ncbi:uncharacterized protein [Epargyreus clarus]|uniref:uncharacterized protein isoform X2 n=1 Tax=Epargyreus clarus TaxID=520877 RepID=UPI003C2DC57C
MAEKLIKKRSSMKAKLTNFNNYLDNLSKTNSLSKLQRIELEGRYSKFDALYEVFDELQTEIELLSDETDEAYSARTQFEELYHSLAARARGMLADAATAEGIRESAGFVTGSEDSVSGRHNNNFIRLPKIDLPHFDGGYQSWLEFRDTFLSLIHDNDGIDTINKFHYLRASLKGSAAEIIKNIIFKKDNYNIAWDLLCERFNNNRLLINFHVQALFNVERLQKESSILLRRLIDITNKNLRALKMMNEPTEHWDTLIIHMMSTKLDPITLRNWEENRNTLNSSPTLAQFCTFVSNKADLLETLEEQNKNNKQENNYKSKIFLITNKVNNQTNNNYQSNQIPSKCPLCSKAHLLYLCETFKSLSIESRIKKVQELNLCKNCLRPGHFEKYCKLAHCKYCKHKHNTLLHLDQSQTSFVNPMPGPSENITLSTSASTSVKQPTTRSIVLLSTAMVRVVSSDGEKHEARMLLDNGSTANFITERLCDKLRLSRRSTSSMVTGINNLISNSTQSCYLNFESINGSYCNRINCLILPVITKNLPPTSINSMHIPIPSGVQLADPTFNIPSAIDILVGAEIFWEVVGSNHIDLGRKQPILCESKLGWIVSGSLSVRPRSAHSHFSNFSSMRANPDLTKFWELDSVSSKHTLSAEERACEESFKSHTFRDNDGRFVVTMPLKANPDKLGDSFVMAKRRFLTLERRFQRDPLFKSMYIDFMREYECLGHMTRDTGTSNLGEYNYFLPHHGVMRESSSTTKLRTVFDASAKTTSGVSLNDIMMVGPTVQDDLLSILLRFRQHRYVVSGDIEKMYRAIAITLEQRSLQRVIFRADPSKPLKTYTLNTVTYGTASAPYLATKCLVSLADSAQSIEAKNAIRRDFYVDDFLSGSNSIAGAVQMTKEVISILSSAKFNLKKFQSNNLELLKQIAPDNETSNNHLNLCNYKNNISSKTLGIYWLCDSDILSFSINIEPLEKITKRHILSVISQIFDPLGLVTPCIIEAKLIMQKLWIARCEWDDVVSTEIKELWLAFSSTLPSLNSLKIPRWILGQDSIVHEIHTFTDASEKAYGACIYVRSTDSSGNITESNIVSEISQEGIEFSFTPAYSPHFNGIAEAAVRSAKHHLKRRQNGLQRLVICSRAR